MFHRLKRYYQGVIGLVFRKPLSLAEKCRLEFGGAVLFSLVLALLIPYFWMNKLTEKTVLDSGRSIAQVVFENHFKLPSTIRQSLPRLSESGLLLTESDSSVRWIRLRNEFVQEPNALSESEKEYYGALQKDAALNDVFWVEGDKTTGEWSRYLRLVRAEEPCLQCHMNQGTASEAFSKGQLIGVLIARTQVRGWAWTRFLNRFWVVIAGLLAATGAMVSFYAITQRVILRPIRQLRALVNNIAEGNYEIRSAIKTGDEYERLSEAFNHMLDNLMESQHKLERANQQLDAKISQLSEKNIELFKANKIKSEFLANMSHEFRTPLNAILGFAELLREKPGADAEKSQRWAENIILSGRSLLNMINDLLDLAKAESAKIEIRVERTSISQLLEGLTAFFSPLTEQKLLKVKLNVAGNIPLIQTDSQKVQQILYNLLSNAVKFTPERGRIQIKAGMLDEKTVRISIKDSGPGISSEHRHKIFEKFHQLDGSITRRGEGTGLGLAICKQLADLLAGSIYLESELGKGSTFSLDLPVTLKIEQVPESAAETTQE